jgi:Tfp pilus assembly protein PilF
MPDDHRAAPSSPIVAVTSGTAGVLFGLIVGYLAATAQDSRPPATSQVPSSPPPAATVPPQSGLGLAADHELEAYKNVLARDPRNLAALTEVGNRLYDAQRYGEAVPYYQQAFALDSSNVSLSTDLGTALWYAGQADQALAQYAKSLAIDPSHGHTLFNIGIVRLEGKRDAKGALEAWERLLATNPAYPERDRVRTLMDQARARLGTP